MIWYVDSVNGSNSNSGHKITEPLQDLSKFYYTGGSTPVLKHGDKILIKRGSVFNHSSTDKLYTNNYDEAVYDPVYIGAYGVGEDPIFTKHKLLNKINLSTYDDNIYTVDLTSGNVTGNPATIYNIGFIYDESTDTIYSDRVFNLSDLHENMQFFIDENNNLYIYCEDYDLIPDTMKLPIYKDIFTCDANLVIDHIHFTLGGKHGVVTTSDYGYYNITIRNCKFDKIGGGSNSSGVRLGNGFESYGMGKNITVENCLFEEIFDTGVTIQGQGATFENVSFNNNVFKKCNQACENWADNSSYSGHGYTNCSFNNNLCLLNGYGFGALNRQTGAGFILSNVTDLTYTDFKVHDNVFYKCKNYIYNTVSFDNTNIKFYNNTIYGFSDQKINNHYTYTLEDYQTYQSTYNQDTSSKFIVLVRDYQDRIEEQTMLSANLFMNSINNIYNNISNESDVHKNNIIELKISSTHTLSLAKAVLIDDMLIFSIIGTAASQIAQYTTFATINIPGYKVTQQSFMNPNDNNKKYYSSQSGDNLLFQSFNQINADAKFEFNGVIGLSKK